MTTLDIILLIALPAVVIGGAIIGLEAFLARRRGRPASPTPTPLFDQDAERDPGTAERLFAVGDETDVVQAVRIVNAPSREVLARALDAHTRRMVP